MILVFRHESIEEIVKLPFPWEAEI